MNAPLSTYLSLYWQHIKQSAFIFKKINFTLKHDFAAMQEKAQTECDETGKGTAKITIDVHEKLVLKIKIEEKAHINV